MNKRVVLYLLSVALLVSQIEAQTAIRIGGSDAPPYRILSGDKPSGFYVEIMNAVGRELGLSLEYVSIPVIRALANMEDGSIDIMLGPNKTAEREEFMLFLQDVPFPREDKCFYVRSGAPDIRKYSDLAGKTIGVVRGTVYNSQFDSDKAITKREVDDYASGFNMLVAGRFDALIIPELQAAYMLKTQRVPVLKTSFLLQGNDSFIAISRASPRIMALAPKMTEVMKKLKADGTFARIIAKYKN